MKQTFLFTNKKEKTWVSVGLEGADVHAAKLVRAWGPSVFTVKSHPEAGEHEMEGKDPVAVFFSTHTPTLSKLKALTITYRIRFGKVEDTSKE